MSYLVEHTERYTLPTEPKIYKSIDDIKKRYANDDTFCDKLIDREIGSLEIGEGTSFMYDFYIDLDVERLS